jgi:hypothetical protein
LHRRHRQRSMGSAHHPRLSPLGRVLGATWPAPQLARPSSHSQSPVLSEL